MRLGPAIAAALAVLGGGGGAWAHSPPLGTGLWWVPSPGAAGERLVIRTPRGLLLESDSAKNDFGFLCNESLSVADGEEASFASLNGDVLLLATWATGLMRGSADGCGWTPVAEVARPAFDVVAAGTTGEASAYVVGGSSNAGDHFWAAADDGTAWSPLANSDYPYSRIRVAPSRPGRVYLTGLGLGADNRLMQRLGVSNDGGRTVDERFVELGPQDLQARVLGVNPLDPDRLHLYFEAVSADLPERVAVSNDAGRSFTDVATLHDIRGFAQAPDGKGVWVGGREGIVRSSDGGQTFSQPLAAVTRVTCLAFHRERLYACGVLGNQLVVAVSDDAGETFRTFFTFDQVSRSVECAGGGAAVSPAVTCAQALAHWRSEVAPPASSPGEPTPGGGGSGGAPSPSTVQPRTSGCAVGGAGHGAELEPTGILVIAALALGVRGARPGRTRAIG